MESIYTTCCGLEVHKRSVAACVRRLEAGGRLPGFDQRSAETVLAEIGADMSPFPSEHHLSSWACVPAGAPLNLTFAPVSVKE